MYRLFRLDNFIHVEHKDASLTIRARAFNILVLGFWHLFILIIMVLILHRFFSPGSIYGATTVLAVTFVSLMLTLAYALSLKGHFRVGVWAFIIAMLGGISVAHYARGSGNAIILVYPIIVMTAGLLLSIRSALGCTVLSILTYIITDCMVGRYGTYLESDPSTLMLNNSLAVIASLIVVLLITWLFTRNLHEYIRELERKNREKEVLLKEIHHRVKNNLQIISSLLSLQSQGVKDERAREAFRESIGRVKSMAMVHERIYISEDLSSIPMKKYIENLLEHIGRAHGPERGISMKADIEDISINIETAINIGLVLNELVNNCYKHAFSDNAPGEKEITVKFRKGIDSVELMVMDNGKGIEAVAEANTLGLQLVKALVEETAGTVDMDGTKGTRITVTICTREDSDVQG